MDQTTRVNLVRNLLTTKELPASVGAKLLDINRTSIYYKSLPVSEEELECKAIIDHLHTDNPTWGARQMSAQLKNRGYHVGRRKARRYMNEMDICPIYPKMNLSKRMQQAKVCPYLLQNAVIDAPNQAWSIDITYIPIKHGLKDSGEGITPKAWQREIDQLAAGKQTDTLAMKSMREDLKAVERLRKTAEQLSRQERDKSHDREPER